MAWSFSSTRRLAFEANNWKATGDTHREATGNKENHAMRVQARCRDFWEKVLPPLLRQKVAERNDSVSRRRGRRGSRLLGSSARCARLVRLLSLCVSVLPFFAHGYNFLIWMGPEILAPATNCCDLLLLSLVRTSSWCGCAFLFVWSDRSFANVSRLFIQTCDSF